MKFDLISAGENIEVPEDSVRRSLHDIARVHFVATSQIEFQSAKRSHHYTLFEMKKITKDIIAQIKSLHKEGMSEREIAKKVGCSRSTVWYHLNKK